MRNTTLSTGLLVLCGVLALGGCRSRGPVACAKPGVYTRADSIALLRIPAGMDAPDTRGSLRVPELNEPAAPLPTVAPCIDQPPKYSNNARLEPTQAERDRARGRGARPAAPPAPAPAAPAPAPTTPATPAP